MQKAVMQKRCLKGMFRGRAHRTAAAAAPHCCKRAPARPAATGALLFFVAKDKQFRTVGHGSEKHGRGATYNSRVHKRTVGHNTQRHVAARREITTLLLLFLKFSIHASERKPDGRTACRKRKGCASVVKTHRHAIRRRAAARLQSNARQDKCSGPLGESGGPAALGKEGRRKHVSVRQGMSACSAARSARQRCRCTGDLPP